MNFYEMIINSDYYLSIIDPYGESAPTVFYRYNGTLEGFNPELWYINYSFTADEFNAHVAEMMRHYAVTIQPGRGDPRDTIKEAADRYLLNIK